MILLYVLDDRQRRQGQVRRLEIGINSLDGAEGSDLRLRDDDDIVIGDRVAAWFGAPIEYDAFGLPASRIAAAPTLEGQPILDAEGFEGIEAPPGDLVGRKLKRFGPRDLGRREIVTEGIGSASSSMVATNSASLVRGSVPPIRMVTGTRSAMAGPPKAVRRPIRRLIRRTPLPLLKS